MALTQLVITGVITIALLLILTSILSFFSIAVSDYLIFLVWLIVLIIFYYILPSKYTIF